MIAEIRKMFTKNLIFVWFQNRQDDDVAVGETSLRHVDSVRETLRDALWTANHLLEVTPRPEQQAIAPAIWRGLCSLLEEVVAVGYNIHQRARAGGSTLEHNYSPERNIRCGVCLENLPTLIMFPCCHIICPRCRPRLINCHICRQLILYCKTIYFD